MLYEREFRNRINGFHSNDIEYEFNRLKRWLIQRCGVLPPMYDSRAKAAIDETEGRGQYDHASGADNVL